MSRLVTTLGAPSVLAAVLCLPYTALASESADPATLLATVEALRAEIATVQGNLDHAWVMTAAALVFLMQGGFLLLEAGLVRSKNSINVAQKNIADFVIATICFYLVGFALMFGPSQGGWFGLGEFVWNQREDWDYTFFVFQLVFCGTAATILSGAVAERMKFSGYLFGTFILALLVYPLYGHWAWGNLLIGDNTAWLADMGFIDFAGSTVVHSVGGWAALAAIIILGPRIGRFDEGGKPLPIHGHSAVLATMGAIILWVGWLGFNGGSTTAGTPAFAHIISNTVLAGAFGGAVAMAIGRWREGLFRPHWPINGVLGGLVAITAGCDAVDTYGAVAIGLSAGAVVYLATHFLEHVGLDDAIGAIPVHGFCGAWGTLMVAPFARPDALAAGSHWEQLGVQAVGVGVGFAWAFGVCFLALWAFSKVLGMRVSLAHELEGLNSAEHGTTLGTGLLQQSLYALASGEADLSKRLDANTGDEAGELAQCFNLLMDKLQGLVTGIAGNAERLVASAVELREVSGALNRDATEMTGKAEGVAGITARVSRNIESMAGSVGGVNDSVAAISESAASISGSIDAVSQEASGMSEAIRAIGRRAESAAAVTSEAIAWVDKAGGSIDDLQAASGRIEAVVDSIRAIAGQTRMLALNATIEAQRAGPAGRGFAVVAEEVKRLADTTARATSEIEEGLGRMRGETGDVVEVLKGVTEVITRLSDSVSTITSEAEAQIAVAGSITGRMQRAAEDGNGIAERIAGLAEHSAAVSAEARDAASGAQEVHGGIDGVRERSQQTLDYSAQVARASSQVSAIADDLGRAVGELTRSAKTA